MSTEKMDGKNERLTHLARSGETVFHARDLANLWGITSANTLYATLKRYAQTGVLFRIYKGFYSLHPPSEINPYLLGVKALHQYAYVSTETILSREGIINQPMRHITLVSAQSKHLTIGQRQYLSRRLRAAFLFNNAGVVEKDGVYFASVERAVADMLYFNPRFHFDAEALIDWKKVRRVQQQVGYLPITRNI
ncbi:MAG: hypothetical protein WBO92_02580 [Candidatus Moraniibacteriota bacterium]